MCYINFDNELGSREFKKPGSKKIARNILTNHFNQQPQPLSSLALVSSTLSLGFDFWNGIAANVEAPSG